MISYHTSQLTYLSLLLIAVWNPHEMPKNTTNHWYFYIVVVFIFSLLLEDCVDVFRKKRYWKSFWNRFSLATRYLLETILFLFSFLMYLIPVHLLKMS